MEQVPDHPAIRRAERTGFAYQISPYIECDWCGGKIYIGQKFYNIHGEVLCCECMDECRETYGG